MSAQQLPPEGHDRDVAAVGGVFEMVDGVNCVNMWVSNCIVGSRSPWRGQSRDNETTS
jgi:hypothetical protein